MPSPSVVIREVSVVASECELLFKAAPTWTQQERKLYRSLRSRLYKQIFTELQDGTLISRNFVKRLDDGSSLTAQVTYENSEIRVCICLVKFHGDGGGGGLDSPFFDAAIPITKSKFVKRDRSWSVKHVWGQPIKLPKGDSPSRCMPSEQRDSNDDVTCLLIVSSRPSKEFLSLLHSAIDAAVDEECNCACSKPNNSIVSEKVSGEVIGAQLPVGIKSVLDRQRRPSEVFLTRGSASIQAGLHLKDVGSAWDEYFLFSASLSGSRVAHGLNETLLPSWSSRSRHSPVRLRMKFEG